ncbi:Homeobox protein Mohawk, partial [Plecturocebus cupreus]
MVAHTCNSSNLGGRGRQITRSRDRDHPGQHNETPSLLKIQKLAGRAFWEAGAGGSRGQEFKTSLAKMAKPTATLGKAKGPECSSMISAHCSLSLLGSRDPPPTSAFQAGLKLLDSSNPSASVSQSARITGISCCIQPTNAIFKKNEIHSLALSPKLECNSMISAHCNLWFLGSSYSSASASQTLWKTDPIRVTANRRGPSKDDTYWKEINAAMALTNLAQGKDKLQGTTSCIIQKSSHIAEIKTVKVPLHFGRWRWVNHLKSGVQDQPGQHGETLSLLKIHKLAGHGCARLLSQVLGRLRQENFLNPGETGSHSVAPAGVWWCRRGAITAHCKLDFPGSSDPLMSASQVARTTGVYRHNWLIFQDFFIEIVLLCCQGWSRTPNIKRSSFLSFPKCQDYRREPLHPAPVSLLSLNGAKQNHFGRLRQADHLRSVVREQPGQHDETPYLPKIQNFAGCGGRYLQSQLLRRLRLENRLNPGGSSAVAQSQLTATFASQVQTILLPQLLQRPRQEDHWSSGDQGCSELCSHHSTPAWMADQEFETSLANMVKHHLYKNTKISWVVPATQEAEARESLEPRWQKLQCNGSNLKSQHFGRPRQADHLRSGICQHGKTLSLLKIQNVV